MKFKYLRRYDESFSLFKKKKDNGKDLNMVDNSDYKQIDLSEYSELIGDLGTYGTHFLSDQSNYKQGSIINMDDDTKNQILNYLNNIKKKYYINIHFHSRDKIHSNDGSETVNIISIYGNIKSNKLNISIYSLNDDYFLVVIYDEDYKELFMSDKFYYKCDGLDGIYSFLYDLII